MPFVAIEGKAAKPFAASDHHLLLVGPAALLGAGREHLATRGFSLVEEPTFERAREALADREFSLIILTAANDRERIAAQCQMLAQAPRGLIIIHPPSETLTIQALEAGADDCLPWQHNPRELVARVRSVLRRHRRAPRPERGRFVCFDEFNLDLLGRQLFARDGQSLSITDTQFRLLCALVERPREVVSRQQLQDLVHGDEADFYDRTVDCQISRLRRRLAQVSGAEIISTYRGVGYRLNAQTRR